jgi:hypothetical protein
MATAMNETIRRMQPYLRQAWHILDSLLVNALGGWLSKVRVIHRGPPLQLLEIDEAIQEAVYRGLLEGRRLDVAYGSREKGEIMSCELSPLGLVFKRGMAYLVCTFWHYTDIRQVMLHQLQYAEVRLGGACACASGICPRSLHSRGEFSYPVGGPIRLAVMFSRGAVFHLYETPLSADHP